MSETPRVRRWTFDRTLNIPTLIGMLVAVGSVFNFIVSQNERIQSIEVIAKGAAEDVKRLERIQDAQARNQAEQIQAFRTEIKGELRDMSQKLDMLLFNRAGINNDLKGWTK